MKKIILAIAVSIVSVFVAQAQTTTPPTSNEPKGELTFEQTSHNFGDINQGQQVTYTFKFKNTGKAPVIISNCLVTCGCTVPNWPKDPILPGKKGEIVANFNSAGKSGMQNKVITVQTNAGQYSLSIISNVLIPAAPAPAAPAETK